MSRKIWSASIAGGLLIGVGLIASAVSSPAAASAQEDAGEALGGLRFLDEVLDDLVGEGTISQDQADAIIEATEAEISEVREQHGGLWPRPGNGGPWAWFGRGFRFGSLLDEGGIDQDEYDSLAEDHPLRQADVTEYFEDGLITPEELRELAPELRWTRPDEAS